jgi:hypothetical protein
VWHVSTLYRRLTARIESRGEVWVYWRCNGRDDVSCVRDVSLGGLFIETPKSFPAATVTQLHFLVQEGQIRADAVVRYVKATSGLGLKLVAISEDDRPKLAALVTRLHSLSRQPPSIQNSGLFEFITT